MASSKDLKVDYPTAFELFGCCPHSDKAELKQAWEELEPKIKNNVKKHKLASDSYNWLSDPKKREWYDIVTDVHDKFKMPDLTGSMFNISSSTLENEKVQKYIDKADKRLKDSFKVEVNLEDVYIGKQIKLHIKRHIICSSCPRGTGKIIIPCTHCTNRPLWQATPLCTACCNTKTQTRNCDACAGAGSIREDTSLQVAIKKGMHHGEKMTFAKKGNKLSANRAADDVIVRLVVREHSRFTRQGYDLFVVHVLTLHEVLCSKYFVFEHIDGRKLKVDHSNVKLEPGCTMLIKNEGMPLPDSENRGDLIISFDVEFPTSTQLQGKFDVLREALPKSNSKLPDNVDYEMYSLKSLTGEKFSRRFIDQVFHTRMPDTRMFPKQKVDPCPVQ